MKRVLKITWRVLAGIFALLIVGLLVIGPLSRGWELRRSLISAIDDSSSIEVVEHSSRWDNRNFDPDFKEKTYAIVTLNQDQIEALRQSFPLTLDYSGEDELMCIFEEHHYIKIVRKNGSILTLHICFHCGQLIVDQGPDRIMPLGWQKSLGKFIAIVGLHPNGPWPLPDHP